MISSRRHKADDQPPPCSTFCHLQRLRLTSFPRAETPAPQIPAPDLNAILARNLFGTADAAPGDRPQAETAKVTGLPLELLGTFVAAVPDQSTAIIARRHLQGILYAVGEDVPGNATLVEIHPHHVMLRRAGVRETLHFPSSGERLAMLLR